MEEKARLPRRLCLVFCAVLTVLLCWRWQRIFYLMCADYILSDMPAHVAWLLGTTTTASPPGWCAFSGHSSAKRGGRPPCP